MTTPVIRVNSVSKLYNLGASQPGYKTLRETIVESCASPWRRVRRSFAPKAVSDTDTRRQSENFWALKDVSFDVQQGEVVGIIGRNGAGKSTLLKILSRITEPTSGRIELRGRLASLLEVGTGFHPEMTGRDNIYMNGSILGMSRREIHRQFDDIVAFAEVDEFLDTPVKRYSSGMYVRLAFAVAAHLEPEILIIDEVLAVGDAAFQKKCLGKMHDVAGHGRTVLFVSHNMAAVQNLCNRIVLLEKGTNTFVGTTTDGIARYHSARGQTHDGFLSLQSHPARRGRSLPLLQSVRFVGEDGQQRSTFATGDPMCIELQVTPVTPLRDAQFGIGIDSWLGARVFSMTTHYSDFGFHNLHSQSVVRCRIEELPLAPGRYFLSLSAGTRQDNLIDAIDDALYLDVEPSDYYGNGAVPNASLGNVVVRSRWDAEALI